jgi:hypothetical protein
MSNEHSAYSLPGVLSRSIIASDDDIKQINEKLDEILNILKKRYYVEEEKNRVDYVDRDGNNHIFL